MERSGEIVAINSDPKAPIFGFCDVAVLGDLHAIIPRALELLRAQALAGHTEER
jgi:electron transfer flavoprotein alpha subunit